MRKTPGATCLAALLLLMAGGARAADEGKYPDWSGGWGRVGGGAFNGSQGVGGATPAGPPQQPPLTPEYQARWDAMKAAQAKGGASNNPVERCLPPGMPRTMIVIDPMEIIITPKTTYMLISYMMEQRRIYTDGRSFPDVEPSFSGYSIGHWEDTEGKGRYDTLFIETRLLKGPRTYDPSGIPFHDDNETVVKEKLAIDKTNPQRLRNDITVEDHALTQPWTVTRYYQHIAKPEWHEYICTENNNWVQIGGQGYYLSPEGLLMPTAKGQPAPDLRYFNQK